ncbi:MAG: hypothetical protein ACRD22_11360 [Terriglobia bacterium]
MKTLFEFEEFEEVLREDRLKSLPPNYTPPVRIQVERPDTPEEILALRARFWELLNERI